LPRTRRNVRGREPAGRPPAWSGNPWTRWCGQVSIAVRVHGYPATPRHHCHCRSAEIANRRGTSPVDASLVTKTSSPPRERVEAPSRREVARRGRACNIGAAVFIDRNLGDPFIATCRQGRWSRPTRSRSHPAWSRKRPCRGGGGCRDRGDAVPFERVTERRRSTRAESPRCRGKVDRVGKPVIIGVAAGVHGDSHYLHRCRYRRNSSITSPVPVG